MEDIINALATGLGGLDLGGRYEVLEKDDEGFYLVDIDTGIHYGVHVTECNDDEDD